MKARKFETISCPHCNYEYLPAEIYIPGSYFGHPYMIERDVQGKILGYEGTSVDLFETYTCDQCNHTFRVISKIGFSTEEDKLENFEEEYTTSVFKNNLFLEEA
jgi:hypothetical protein